MTVKAKTEKFSQILPDIFMIVEAKQSVCLFLFVFLLNISHYFNQSSERSFFLFVLPYSQLLLRVTWSPLLTSRSFSKRFSKNRKNVYDFLLNRMYFTSSPICMNSYN